MKTMRKEQSRNQDLQKQHSLADSISDFRKVYPEMSDQQLALRFKMHYGVSVTKVLSTIAKMNQPTGGGVA
jgi:hypothetical protein